MQPRLLITDDDMWLQWEPNACATSLLQQSEWTYSLYLVVIHRDMNRFEETAVNAHVLSPSVGELHAVLGLYEGSL